jgi:hypothetical protein
MLGYLLRKKGLAIFFFFVLVFSPSAARAGHIGVIDSTERYAWGENIGWVDFGTSQGAVRINNGELSGYAWGENIGWISLNCQNNNSCDQAKFAVSVGEDGRLSGYAWGENVGWINFQPGGGGVTINADGVFFGYAWGENVGWIVFNCATTQSCDQVSYLVSTDWRPSQARAICHNGLDDDGDGLIDYPDDPDCISAGGSVEAAGVEPWPKAIEDIRSIINDKQLPLTKKIIEVGKLLPQLVTAASGELIGMIQDLQNNEQVQVATRDVLMPITVTGGSVALGTLFLTELAVLDLPLVLVRGWLFLLELIGWRRRKKPWGIVYDALTKRPLPLARVNIFSVENNKLRDSQISDSRGRFGFLVKPGDYYLTAGKPNYVFPSSIVTTDTDSGYIHIYRSGSLSVGDEQQQKLLLVNIPLDPPSARPRRIWLTRFFDMLKHILTTLHVTILLFGVFISLFVFVVVPDRINTGILAFYVLLLFMKFLADRQLRRSWGTVSDAVSGQPLGLASIRIFDERTGRLLLTRASDELGKFYFILKAGNYRAEVSRHGYTQYKTTLSVSRREGAVINVDFKLSPVV